MTEPSPQRAYRAACPNCGAPVDFRSPSSAFAVCSYCRSQVVRDGDTLRRIGHGAELFDDHSPLQLGAAGTLAGAAFTLVGRKQYRYAEGTWNEWHALFDNGRSGWLSEDNGRYVFAFDAPLAAPMPPAEALRAGARVVVLGQPWSVASVVSAMLIAAQGELPAPPVIGRAFVVADLRNAQGEVGTLDYGDPAAPVWSVGRTVALADLAMRGLAEPSEKTLSGRTLNCPSCGNGVAVTLATTQSVVCGQCHAVIDLTSAPQGDLGGALAHYQQEGGGSEPQIPLGSVGTLALGGRGPLPWQVVGYAERRDLPDDGDESTYWREYLLYHRTEGFAFLVDAEDGWSWVVPLTGAPEVRGNVARVRGTSYAEKYTYRAEVTWVLGEFYWKLARGQQARVTDYAGTGAAARRRLSREETRADGATEVVWSEGEALEAEAVRQAFRLPETSRAALARDTAPVSSAGGSLGQKIVVWVLIIVVLMVIAKCTDEDDCDDVRSAFGASSREYQQCIANRGSGGSSRGGSWGGFSSGGGHK